ncbi:MAG: uracil-DNA glycosylase [Lentisphaeria bacterium]|jgi:uracil-DNA glycosylase
MTMAAAALAEKLAAALPADWRRELAPALALPAWAELAAFLAAERAAGPVFPAAGQTFAAFHQTPFAAVRVVILGQDPYHDDGQAHGLAFSVPPGVRPPPSLRNIFRELRNDLGDAAAPATAGGDLSPWARQGCLLLNTVLTVRAHQPHSHKGRWEFFTDAVIRALSARPAPVAFVLWGGPAQGKLPLIAAERQAVICGPHPSPLSAHRGFFGSRPFSAVDRALAAWGQPPFAWRLAPAPAAAAGEEALAQPLLAGLG